MSLAWENYANLRFISVGEHLSEINNDRRQPYWICSDLQNSLDLHRNYLTNSFWPYLELYDWLPVMSVKKGFVSNQSINGSHLKNDKIAKITYSGDQLCPNCEFGMTKWCKLMFHFSWQTSSRNPRWPPSAILDMFQPSKITRSASKWPNKLLLTFCSSMIACNVSTKGFAFYQSITDGYLENDKMTKIAYSSDQLCPNDEFRMQKWCKLKFYSSWLSLFRNQDGSRQPIDPIYEYRTKMDFLTQITYILMGHTYILPKIGILAILKKIFSSHFGFCKKK